MSIVKWLKGLSAGQIHDGYQPDHPRLEKMPPPPPPKQNKPAAFDLAFKRVIGHEGKYTDRRDDRGNWTSGIIGQGELKGTKYGISAMSYPHLDIKNITLDQAKDIYREDYWFKSNIDQLPNGIGFQVFDSAVNHGSGNGVRFLQKALGVTADGIIGKNTIHAAWSADEAVLILDFNAERLRFYTSLSTWGTYGKGWTNRVSDCLRHGAEDVK